MTEEKKIKPLYLRRQAFAEKQAKLGRGSAGGPPLGSGPANRHGMPQAPMGQRIVRDWPVLDLGDLPRLDRASWSLTVDGAVDRPRTYSFEDLLRLPQTDDTSDFHCVTGWSRLDNRWRGVRLIDLAEDVGVRDDAEFLEIEAFDHAPGTNIPYTTNVAIDEALAPDVMLVHTWEGAPLPREHGGPVRMITPRLYAWKGAKWIRRITWRTTDAPGFWEVRGYSNTADPWQNDRYNRG